MAEPEFVVRRIDVVSGRPWLFLSGELALRLHDAQAAEKSFRQCIVLAPRSCQSRQCSQAWRQLQPPAVGRQE